eukprot:CAMPEP_0202907142 /NCGR_PEP_ID=MMETSP1392-20130828/41493_1 /ASSEMBLY_ACC=CAM_ASM_000868 /TAXON_ID=225041 /ORGANISM="Chlamydomonas chlamydogama, Strain SAG 11-48b" /LENGTH=196 /DNA_ID=CAMNT_0049595921 /DNA_START=1 /DNA_END=588 /DNA_ORIENTATION=+
MTSNLGSAEIFSQAAQEKDRALVKEKVMEHVRSHFRPEFINRVDDFITFEPLREDQIRQIVKLRAQRLVGRLAERRMALELRDSAVERLAKVGYDPVYGARPVKRALQRELQTLLAKALLRGDFEEDDTVVVEAAPSGSGLVLSKGPKLESARLRSQNNLTQADQQDKVEGKADQQEQQSGKDSAPPAATGVAHAN